VIRIRSEMAIARDWNDTAAPYPRELGVHDLFERQVDRTPESLAVVSSDGSLTYGELDRRANQVARLLRSRGVGPEVVVGICLEPSLDMVVALLGVWKAGGAYLPLDPHYPTERIRFAIEDSELALLVTEPSLADRVGAVSVPTIHLDANASRISDASDCRLGFAAEPESLAYLIYTSGSTGKPKGVQVPHRAVVNFLRSMAREPGLAPGDVLLAVTTLSFDISVLELFLPLVVGATVVVASRNETGDGRALMERLELSGATVMQATPSTWRMLLEAGWPGSPGLKVLCGGEALTRDLADRLLERVGQVWNMYGPTETTVWSTCCQVEPGAEPVSIGRPIANTWVYILDPQQRPVAVGVEGELYIGGDGVTRGYWRRPELTAERFLADPFHPEPGARMYRTGDLVRYRDDGQLDYRGRIDHQVKIRGFRVELGEIEAVLAEHPGVGQAAVAAHDYGPGDRRLVAYIVPLPERGRTGLASEVRSYLQERLPAQMVPGAYEVLDALPLAPNGKLDRKALPMPSQKRPDLEQAYAPPRNELEQYLAGRWSRILQIEQVGVHDRFFELGGDSIQAAMFINGLHRDLGEPIYIVTLFDAPTIAEYAEFLRRDYGPALEKKFGPDASAGGRALASARASARDSRVDAAMLDTLRRSVPGLRPIEGAGQSDEPRNAPAIFILAPPRSGTTLLRVMLAGHPRLFAASELQLLGFHTLGERRRAFTGKHAIWRDGVVRVLMETERCDADNAKSLMERYEARDLATKRFYNLLQARLGDRMLVDKSPSYALDPEALRKAERDFRDAIYIHLVRHPYAAVRSFVNMRMDQVMYLRDHGLSARQLGEAIWTLSHRNIASFLDEVPEGRKFRLTFENLVRNPESTMRALCSAVGLEFHPSLVTPYEDVDRKMTDGVYAESTPMGDPRFRNHGRIDSSIADRWRDVAFDDFLGAVTWETAIALGYPPPAHGEVAGSSPTNATGAGEESRGERLRRKRESRVRARSDGQNDESIHA
jgi:amino acid adenylation domain-containing protein